MTKEELNEKLEKAKTQYQQSLAEWYMAEHSKAEATLNWDVFFTDGLMNGTITGKNDNERIAHARAIGPSVWNDKASAELEVYRLRSRKEIAKAEWDYVGRLLRIEEALDEAG